MSIKKLPVLTSSALRKYRLCPRLYFHEYVLGYRSLRRSEAMAFGTLIHVGLEAWWLAVKRDDRPSDLRLSSAIVAMRAFEASDYDLAKAEAIMVAYHERWTDACMTVLGVEVEYETSVVNPSTGKESRTYRHGGKIDAIADFPSTSDLATLSHFIVEHKTTSEDCTEGSNYWRILRLDNQVSNYIRGARSLGFDVEGCIYDVIRKPMVRPKKATLPEKRRYNASGKLDKRQREEDETPEEFGQRYLGILAQDPEKWFKRGHVVRLEDEEHDAESDLWQLAKAIRESERAERWPRNPDACIHPRYGRECDFFDVCTNVESLDNPLAFRKVKTMNEELSND